MEMSPDENREYSLSRGTSCDATGPNYTARHYSYEELELFNRFKPDHWESPFRHEVMIIKRLKYSDGVVTHRVEFSAIDSTDRFGTTTKRIWYEEDGVKQVQQGGYALVNATFAGQDCSPLLSEIPTIDQLPDTIDTMATYNSFIAQAERADFSKPQLILPTLDVSDASYNMR